MVVFHRETIKFRRIHQSIKYLLQMVSEPLYKRPFYFCVLSCQAFDLEWGWRWPCCDRDQFLVSMISNQFKFDKQQCLYHNKVNLSLTSIQRVGRQAGNCKMGYSKLEITVHCNLIHAPYEKQQQQKKLYSFASWQIFSWTQFSSANEAGEELSYLDVNTDEEEFWFLHIRSDE